MRDDGVEVKWEVTFPAPGLPRGLLPFFCHDTTPRGVRVPITEEAVTHPSGVYGIKSLKVKVPGKDAGVLAKVYEAVLGLTGSATDGAGLGASSVKYSVSTVASVNGVAAPEIYVEGYTGGNEAVGEIVEKHGVALGDLILGGISDAGDDQFTRLDQTEDYGRIVVQLQKH